MNGKELDYPSDFLAVCRAYPPPRLHRAVAYESWLKIQPSAIVASEMLEWVTAARTEHPDWQDGAERLNFVPLLSTWLNQRRWEDPVGLPPVSDSAYRYGIKNFTYVCPAECGHYPFGAGMHFVNVLVAQRVFHVQPSFASVCSSTWVSEMFAPAKHLVPRIPAADLFELAEPWVAWRQEGRV